MDEDYGVGCGFGGGAIAEGFGCAVRERGGFIGHELSRCLTSGVGGYLRGAPPRVRHFAIRRDRRYSVGSTR